MGKPRVAENGGFYVVEAGGRLYLLPKQHVEQAGPAEFVSKRTGYRFLAESDGLKTLPPLRPPPRSRSGGDASGAQGGGRMPLYPIP